MSIKSEKPQKNSPAPRPLVLEAVKRAGYVWNDILRNANQVILFGSHANGVAGAWSDVDLAIVGDGESRLSRHLDLVWISRRSLDESQWLGSEIATHIAAYGVWLFGDDSWRRSTHVSDEAAWRKSHMIQHHVRALQQNLPLLSPPYRAKHFAILRRDLQRLDHLIRRQPVIPTPSLDALWDGNDAWADDINKWIGSDVIPPNVQCDIRRLIAGLRTRESFGGAAMSKRQSHDQHHTRSP